MNFYNRMIINEDFLNDVDVDELVEKPEVEESETEYKYMIGISLYNAKKQRNSEQLYPEQTYVRNSYKKLKFVLNMFFDDVSEDIKYLTNFNINSRPENGNKYMDYMPELNLRVVYDNNKHDYPWYLCIPVNIENGLSYNRFCMLIIQLSALNSYYMFEGICLFEIIDINDKFQIKPRLTDRLCKKKSSDDVETQLSLLFELANKLVFSHMNREQVINAVYRIDKTHPRQIFNIGVKNRVSLHNTRYNNKFKTKHWQPVWTEDNNYKITDIDQFIGKCTMLSVHHLSNMFDWKYSLYPVTGEMSYESGGIYFMSDDQNMKDSIYDDFRKMIEQHKDNIHLTIQKIMEPNEDRYNILFYDFGAIQDEDGIMKPVTYVGTFMPTVYRYYDEV